MVLKMAVETYDILHETSLTGILFATGTHVSDPNQIFPGQKHPGWEKPVPLEYFREDI